MNGYEEEDDGQEQCAGDEDQSGAVDVHGVVGVHEGGFDEPGQAQAQHVEDIGAHDVGHGHVGLAWGGRKVQVQQVSHTDNSTVSELMTGVYLLWPPSRWPRCRGCWSQQPAG